MLRQLSQNFPKYANALARRVPTPPQEFEEEIAATRMQLPQGFSGLWVNGLLINEPDVNILRCAHTYSVQHLKTTHLITLSTVCQRCYELSENV